MSILCYILSYGWPYYIVYAIVLCLYCTVLQWIISHYTMLCYIMLYFINLYYYRDRHTQTQRHTDAHILYHIILCCVLFYCTRVYHIIVLLYHTTLYNIIPYHKIVCLYHIFYCTIPSYSYILVYDIVLYCIVVYYITLYYVMLLQYTVFSYSIIHR